MSIISQFKKKRKDDFACSEQYVGKIDLKIEIRTAGRLMKPINGMI